jgi:tryptophan synthase alpha chain
VNTLTSDIRALREKKDVLLMTHLVLGYPSLEVNAEVVRQMVANGVDLIELQIPFSEPVADGPVISHACQEAIAGGVTVRRCLDFAAAMTKEHPIPFLFMTYYNILFCFGEAAFVEEAKKIGVRGLIVPDLPPEEGEGYLATSSWPGDTTSHPSRSLPPPAVTPGCALSPRRREVSSTVSPDAA